MLRYLRPRSVWTRNEVTALPVLGVGLSVLKREVGVEIGRAKAREHGREGEGRHECEHREGRMLGGAEDEEVEIAQTRTW